LHFILHPNKTAMKFNCPRPTALKVMPASVCGMKFDQFAMGALQLVQPSASRPFTPALPANAKASWVSAMAALGAAKMVLTPVFAGLVIPPSERQEEGGNDNSTFKGIPRALGRSAILVELTCANLSTEQLVVLRSYEEMSLPTFGGFSLTIGLFNVNNQALLQKVFEEGEEVADTYEGIPLYNFHVGGTSSEGLNQDNKNVISFYLPADWDERVALVDLDFNPFVELQAAA